MKLTNENIQFIDNYLKNSDVIYSDIRMEMLDHVATAVEQKMQQEDLNFYDTFKNYMVINKTELLKLNKEEGLYFIEPLKKFSRFLFQPFQLGLALFAISSVRFFVLNFGLKSFHDYCFGIVTISYLIFGIIHFLINKKNKFYYIDKNFSILFLLFQVGNLFYRSINDNLTSVVIFNGAVLFIYIAFLRFYYIEMKCFRMKNQYLFQ